MNVDLPPLSAFIPDPAVARTRTRRDTLTLAQQPEQGAAIVQHEVMSGNIVAGPSPADESASYRVAVAVAEELPLTLTF